jgi:glutamate racemase
MSNGDPRPIGVFDSGIGGLTVVAELQRQLPGEDIVYFGDTARVPYGTKSAETVTRFAREDCAFLLRFNPKLIVVACNTASAIAMTALEEWLSVPVCGVVEPGAQAAVAAARGRIVAVIATEATIASDAYRQAIQARHPHLPVVQKACPLLVPIVEEGRRPDDPVVKLVMAEYLEPLRALTPGALVLG